MKMPFCTGIFTVQGVGEVPVELENMNKESESERNGACIRSRIPVLDIRKS